ncbi:DUF1190 domain-containing protein [Microbulbifer sp. 2205BS26-8]|uniref:DUF1190 domain-containing protein n=1 Tax=Microbulbifer sp. 2205BS26-8 TaxID=3064386 RepID=UPI00273EF11A|nr:DUF1190 domain-containing protein [Microbulbifer sp. 2205BS26-8]MDP5208699.1 DUF1190 domain-containing protein [Microbulbifer sp. 2205BS26-8]
MKRTRTIDLSRMRKGRGPSFLLRPLAISVAAVLMGCSSDEEVKVVASIEDCVDNTQLDEAQCEAAYQRALAEAERTGPKYASLAQCEGEFEHCRENSSGFWMPLMTGFMVASILNDSDRRYHSRGYYNPVYRYSAPGSRYHDRLMTADGQVIGRSGKTSYRVDKSTTQPKPKVTKTVSRGGFGAVASAKSNWGGGRSSSRSRGWGG